MPIFRRLLFFLYSSAYTLALLLYLPVLGYRILFHGKRFSVLGRLSPPETAREGDSTAPKLWVHAVSVGEVNAARPLVSALLSSGYRVALSTTTDTGQRLACESLPKEVSVFYFPLDWRWNCRRYLKALRPDVVLLVETEIWPNFVEAASETDVPILLVNGRISDTSFRNYLQVRVFLKHLLSELSHFCMQSKQDRQRILELGAPPERVNWVGNLKYDYQLPASSENEDLCQSILSLLNPTGERQLLLCGSTRDGEEALLLPVFLELLQQNPGLRLILAPRHLHRVDEVARLLEERSVPFLRRSQLSVPFEDAAPGKPPPLALLLDSIGELAHLYRVADIVFIGGSLVPTGGHNMIEAAAWGKPILYGPHMENFREVAHTFTESYAALQVASAEELKKRLDDLIRDPAARDWLGRNARRVIRDNQGAVKRTLEIVQRYAQNTTEVE